MDPALYRRMRESEDRHWWFRARRTILAGVLQQVDFPPDAAILDAGCGTGGNLALLSALGRVTGMESDADARRMAAERGCGMVVAGALPHDVPCPHETFDLVTLLDVLEHVERDDEALRKVFALLKPGGRLLVTVPAFMFLWGAHDTAHHHHRRYTRGPLCAQLREAGFVVQRASYFNTWLFPLIAAVRLLRRRGAAAGDDLNLPPRWVNATLEAIMASERHVLRHAALPIGVSLLLIADKPAS